MRGASGDDNEGITYKTKNMKKIYLSLAAALICASASSAKELTFYLGNNAIENNGKVSYDLQAGDVDDFGDYVEYNIQPKLYLHADLVGQVEVNVASNHEVDVCIGSCVTDTDITRTLNVQSNQKLDLQYHMLGKADNVKDIPTYISTFTAYYTNDKENTKKSFTITVNPGTGAVKGVALTSDFGVVDGGIAYAVESPATLTIYSLTGRKVLSTKISGTGTISTSNLPTGVYLCQLNGKTKKIVLK